MSLLPTGSIIGIAATLVLGGCATSPKTVDAVIPNVSSADIEVVKSTLSDAMGRTNIDLGPLDLEQNSSVTVLPPRPTEFETRSTVLPTVFTLVVRGEDCFLRQEESGALFPLDGIACIAQK